MLKPICVKCHRFYRPKKTGFYFTEGRPAGDGAEPGLGQADQWRPYKLWSGDLYECQGCGSAVVVGSGQQPIAVDHEEDFQRAISSFGAEQFQVNDC